MLCELCGKNESFAQVLVEGSSIKACRQCKTYGKVTGILQNQEAQTRYANKKIWQTTEQPAENIMTDYAAKIRQARERLGKTHEEFAQLLKEKTSVIHKLETAQFEPSIQTAKKIEKILKIKLIELTQTAQEKPQKQTAKTQGYTIGDFMQLQ